MLLTLLGFAMKTHFVVSHHVQLEDHVMSATEFRRNGSLVGSKGWSSLHDGKEVPLIVVRGKELKLPGRSNLRFNRLLGTVGKYRYKAQSYERQAYSIVDLSHGVLTPIGNPVKYVFPKSNPPNKNYSTRTIEKLFPYPEGVDSSLDGVYWSNLAGNAKLGEVEFSIGMESMWRAAYIDKSGKMSRLESNIEGLNSCVVRCILYVDPKGWMVVDASEAPFGNNRGAYIGHGNHVFWIEPR